MYGFISLSKMDRVILFWRAAMATVTAFTAFSNCQILFSQYFTNLLKNWQLALRKLPICVLTKIHKNVHGRACFFPWTVWLEKHHKKYNAEKKTA